MRAALLRSTCLVFLLALSLDAQAAADAPPKPPAPAKNKLTLTEQNAARVAVVVNDSAVTNSDIIARYGMMLFSSGLQDSPDTRARIMPQVVRSLIEEQLQLQEARRQQIEVSDAEISHALERIARENNVPGGDVRRHFSRHGIPPRTLESQARANIAWGKLVQRQLRPRVEVSDDEVDEVINRMQANVGKTEYFVNEIFLPVDDPDQDAAVQGFANKLLAQIKQTGAFGAVARQFSQGAGAPNGGEIGWVQQGSLAPEIDAALAKSTPGGLMGPIRSSKGYHIIAVRDQRTVTMGGDAGTIVRIAQVARGMPPQGQQAMQAAVAEARKKAEAVRGCAELDKQFPAAQGWNVQMLPERPVSALTPGLASVARSHPVGKASDIDVQPGGFGFVVICERTESNSIDRLAIYNTIGGERLDNLARGLLRDLKRNAYIDMRI